MSATFCFLILSSIWAATSVIVSSSGHWGTAFMCLAFAGAWLALSVYAISRVPE